MDLIEVPAGTHVLDDHEHLDVPHRMVGLTDPLEHGQIVVLRDLDGRHRWASVDGVRFTETDTVYELRLGHPMPAETAVAVGAYDARPSTRPFVRTTDVVRMLEGLREKRTRQAELSARARAARVWA